jgi:Asp/Glu/hydantoin racemase
MRIRAITPMYVDAAELERRQRRYDRLAPAGVSVRLDNLGAGSEVPRALDTADDVGRSEALVAAALSQTDPRDFDAALPDCVLDPAVGTPGTVAPVPVFGILRLSAHLLAGTGEPFAAVARNDAIADELARKAAEYGFGDRLQEVRVLGLAAADIPDDAAWAAAISRAVVGLNVPAVINGCSAVELSPRGGQGPRVIDPTAAALRVLGLVAELGLAGAAATSGAPR